MGLPGTSLWGPKAVLEYLDRYTHRVAISNSRLLRMEEDQVVFTWRDYAHGSRMKQMSLSAEEFIRRFLLHVLPEGFVRIRDGLLAPAGNREKELALCRQLLRQAEPWCLPLSALTGRISSSDSKGRTLSFVPAAGPGNCV